MGRPACTARSRPWPSQPQSSSSTCSKTCKPFKTAPPTRRGAAHRAKAEEAVDKETVGEVAEEVTVVVEVVAAQKAEELIVKANHVLDEFRCNAEYTANILSDENSVRYRFIVKEDILYSESEVFKGKVRQNFVNKDVEISNKIY